MDLGEKLIDEYQDALKVISQIDQRFICAFINVIPSLLRI